MYSGVNITICVGIVKKGLCGLVCDSMDLELVFQLMDLWGEIMRRQYNKDTSYRDSDLTNNYIGYWTDNGLFCYSVRVCCGIYYYIGENK